MSDPSSGRLFTSFPFAASGRSGATSAPDRFGGTYINAKDDFKAAGDGSADDTIKLQAAFDAAFGVAGSLGFYGQRRLILPPGNYRVTGDGLTGRNWFGGCVQGSGRFATRIFNSATNGPVITANGCQYMRFDDMRLSSNGTGTIFDLDWDNSGTALQSNEFNNIYFDGGATGLRVAHSGFMGSEGYVKNCFFSGLSASGLEAHAGNALQWTVSGGNFQTCGIGILSAFGAVNVVQGVGFQQSADYDIKNTNAGENTMCVVGCRTESPNFINNSSSRTMAIYGCHQTSAVTPGNFLLCNGGFLDMSACILDGKVDLKGSIRACIRACWPTQNNADEWLVLVPSDLWWTPNNRLAASIELENICPYSIATNAYDSNIEKQRRYTADGVTITTKNYAMAA